jgi:hypothetical protein
MNLLTLARVVPTISAKVDWLTFKLGRARLRAWGSREERWACEARAEKWEANRLLTNPNACFIYRNSLIPRARAT